MGCFVFVYEPLRLTGKQKNGLPDRSFTHVATNIGFHVVPDSEAALNGTQPQHPFDTQFMTNNKQKRSASSNPAASSGSRPSTARSAGWARSGKPSPRSPSRRPAV